MSQRFISPIVEGHGELQAVPLLIRKIFAELSPQIYPEINPPIRVKAGSFLNDENYFHKYVSLAGAKAAQASGEVLILLDCEDDCPAELGPRLLEKALAVRNDIPTTVVLAHREYETWFLASVESLSGRGLPEGVTPPPNPEAIRGAKEWLGKAMGVPYDPIQHQAPFTANFNLQQARSIPSFDRLVTKLIS